MMNYPFADAPSTATIVCSHIIEKGDSILFVAHDKDGMWQFLCGESHEPDEARIVDLESVFEFDPSIGVLHDMPLGSYIERLSPEDDWTGVVE